MAKVRMNMLRKRASWFALRRVRKCYRRDIREKDIKQKYWCLYSDLTVSGDRETQMETSDHI